MLSKICALTFSYTLRDPTLVRLDAYILFNYHIWKFLTNSTLKFGVNKSVGRAEKHILKGIKYHHKIFYLIQIINQTVLHT